jgi:release factor glutamine methyltransferase
MTRREALLEGTRILAEQGPRGSETPSLDASLLLAAALSIEKDRLLSSLPDGIDEASRGRFLGLVAERAKGRPVAYLVGRKEFWGHEFYVDERVLVPRPDTELLVELALREGCRIGAERATRGAADGSARAVAPCHAPLGLHEACTGSGCVAISLALERPGWKVSASDISPGALAVARRNAMLLLPTERAGGDVDFLEADLLDLHDPDAGPAREAAAGGVSAACREAQGGDARLAVGRQRGHPGTPGRAGFGPRAAKRSPATPDFASTSSWPTRPTSSRASRASSPEPGESPS